ncbi:MAG: hypothetical protein AAEI92_04660 [Arenicellales bacterium]
MTRLNLLKKVREYLGRKRRKLEPILNTDRLGEFIDSRSSLVAQTSLYGYIKTRAGTRFPDLFENEEFLRSINIAKWQIWTACVSDLAVFAGGLLYRELPDADRVRQVLRQAIDPLLVRTAQPSEAGEDFSAALERLNIRIAGAAFTDAATLENAFTVSPDALVYWAPIVDELKSLDESIVRNSIRFRWQAPRRELREALHSARVFDSLDS